MELLAGRQAAASFAELPGLDLEKLLACRLIGVLGPHLFPQHLADERDTLVSRLAVSTRAHRATSSSKGMVTFFMPRE
jgi:hypothetical protein